MARFNNQFILVGTSPEFKDDSLIMFLEYVEGAGTFTVADALNTVLTGAVVGPLDLTHAPIRFDGGLKLNGTVLFAKGFFIETGLDQTIV